MTDYIFINGTEINSQNINEHSEWTFSQSPYIVSEKVTIPSDLTVTVFPGVTIYFLTDFIHPQYHHPSFDIDGYYSSTYSNEKSGLTVEGSFIASGTENNPIIFTSSLEQAYPGSWDGVQVNNGSCTFNFCKIMFAKYGVQLENSNASISNSEVIYQGFYPGNDGRSFSGGIYVIDSKATITSNKIHCCEIGIIAENSSIFIRDNNISYNTFGGIYIYYKSYFIIEKNNVHHNKKGGINVSVGFSPEFEYQDDEYLAKINNNSVYYNDLQGISLKYPRLNEDKYFGNNNKIALKNNLSFSNKYFGIHISNASYYTFLELHNNTVYQNGLGLRIAFDSSESSNNYFYSTHSSDNFCSIINNYIYNNIYTYNKNVYHYADSFPHHEVRINSSYDIDFRQNKWGEDIIKEIKSGEPPINISFFDDGFDHGDDWYRKGKIIYDGSLSGDQQHFKHTGEIRFIDANDNHKKNYNKNEKIMIYLKDSDLNIDSQQVENVRIIITSETENQIKPGGKNSYPVDSFVFSATEPQIVGENVLLYETGADTGIFKGSIPLEYNENNSIDNKL